MQAPTTPTNKMALIQNNTRCILLKDVEVKVEDTSNYPEHEHKVYNLRKGSQVVTRGNPTPAILTGSTELLSVHNASYRILATMNLPVYEAASDELPGNLNFFHSNLKPLNPTIDTSKPFPKGTIVSVKQRVLDVKGEEQASPSQLLKITSELPLSPRTGFSVTGRSLALSTAKYTVQKVKKVKRNVQVFNFLKIMHADLMELE